MQSIKRILLVITTLFLQGCLEKGPNPEDPYESINRPIYKFNQVLDTAVAKPTAKFYTAIMPVKLRAGINNFYNNINMIPTVINDLLQADFPHASQDFRRLILNSTIGLGGILDPAVRYDSPLRSNDLGITFALWGDKQSPYVMIPLLGPSTIRDGMALMFDYTFFTPYPYIPTTPLYALLVERYVDLRAQMLDNDKLISESLDKYAFIRDAYLQHRRYLIQGEGNEGDTSSLYVDDEYPTTDKSGLPSGPEFPLTTASFIPTIQSPHPVA